MERLFLFEAATLLAMMEDARRVSQSPVNDTKCRVLAQGMVDEIQDELQGRRVVIQ
jgi:hypothetical protein